MTTPRKRVHVDLCDGCTAKLRAVKAAAEPRGKHAVESALQAAIEEPWFQWCTECVRIVLPSA